MLILGSVFGILAFVLPYAIGNFFTDFPPPIPIFILVPLICILIMAFLQFGASVFIQQRDCEKTNYAQAFKHSIKMAFYTLIGYCALYIPTIGTILKKPFLDIYQNNLLKGNMFAHGFFMSIAVIMAFVIIYFSFIKEGCILSDEEKLNRYNKVFRDLE